jgi:FKBP-type peptidyl-prolyl cis-trans isomerase FkpA
MNLVLVLASALAAALPAPESKADDSETLYAAGAVLGQRLQMYRFSAAELARIQRGFADAAAGRPLRLREKDLEEWGPKIDAMLQRRGNPKLSAAKQQGAAFAATEAKQGDARRLDGGVVLRTLRPGEGETPKAGDRVRVKYQGRTVDGAVFDPERVAEVPLAGVVRCWSIALPNLKVGATARLICPSSTAYGDQGRPPQVPGGATVVFDVELLAIVR